MERFDCPLAAASGTVNTDVNMATKMSNKPLHYDHVLGEASPKGSPRIKATTKTLNILMRHETPKIPHQLKSIKAKHSKLLGIITYF